MKERRLIDIAKDGMGNIVVKYEYTEYFDSSIVGNQEKKTHIGKWESIQKLSDALRFDNEIHK